MKLLNVATLLSTVLLVSYIFLRFFTDLISPAFSESFILEFLLIFMVIGLHTFRSWKAEEEEY